MYQMQVKAVLFTVIFVLLVHWLHANCM